jgi:hypothetical protein
MNRLGTALTRLETRLACGSGSSNATWALARVARWTDSRDPGDWHARKVLAEILDPTKGVRIFASPGGRQGR